MIPNNNISPLPFYESKSEWDSRKIHTYGEVFPLICPRKKLIPFQLFIPHPASWDLKVYIRNVEDVTEYNLTTSMVGAGLTITAGTTYDTISYPALTDLIPIDSIAEGRHYLQIYNGYTLVAVSEIMTLVEDVSQHLKLSYTNYGDLIMNEVVIKFISPFTFIVYLDTAIGKPDYTWDEEVIKRDGRIFVQKQISEKVFRFDIIASEYLCDALRLVRLHDRVTIEQYGKLYVVDNIIITPKWQETGSLAAVEVEFNCDTIVKKTGKLYYEGGSYSNGYSSGYEIET